MTTYLGFDAGTQGLTATVIEIAGREERRIVFEPVLEFDATFPQYGTTHGVIASPDGRTVTAPPAMWAAALDRMGQVLADSGLDRGAIRAVTGAAQQHGSVYLAEGAGQTLRSLDPSRPLVDQVSTLFSRPVAPVWLDASTAAECASLTHALGGDAALARLTGSRAYERFTAAQIRRFASTDPAGYARTERVHLVSSFMASLLGRPPRAARATPAGNGGGLMTPWFVPEITPPVAQPGPRRMNLVETGGPRVIRAIVEGQAMAMRLHSRGIAPKAATIRATGGAAANRELLQVIADVFDAEVVRGAPRNSASLGAALRAYHAERRMDGHPVL